MSLLITFAMPEEARAFRRRPLPSGVRVAFTGVGRRNTERARAEILAGPPPSWVISSGFAGGLNPQLRAAAVVYSADAEFPFTPALRAAGAIPGEFLCVDRIATLVTEKAALRLRSNADAVEMESEIIRRTCREHGIPAATVRVISDAADEDLPLDFNTLMTADQRLHFGKLAWKLVTSPGRLPHLLAFRRRVAAAAERLAEVLQAVTRAAA